MTESEALKVFNKDYPKLTATTIMDCNKYFVIIAVEDISKLNDAIDPYYFVMKSDRSTGGFNPNDDLDAFTNPNNKVTKLI